MTEAERSKALKDIQLELFELKSERAAITSHIRFLERKARRITTTGVKTCRQCRVEMPVDQFYADRQKVDGRDSYCIECRLERNKISRRAKAA